MSKKQDCTAMSLAKAEYVVLSASCAQVMWMRTQLKDYGYNYIKVLRTSKYSESNAYALEDLKLGAGNPVKEHQDSSTKKAQVLKTKTSAYFDIKDNSSETKLQGRLLDSFQEDAKYEHVGQDTRSQGGKDDQDK
ncbi:hypothetical protein Tco_0664271 [Tanacetum coccineum]